jgi:hypothetical protein
MPNEQSTSRKADENGYWEINDNPISKVGVFPYSGNQVSDEFAPDEMVMVLRSEEELSDPECVASFNLIPLIDDHAMLGANDEGLTPPEEHGVMGTLGDSAYYKDGTLYNKIKLFAEKIKQTIDGGKKELSMGYRCVYEKINGVYNGQEYQAVQRQIRGNHAALVHEGRMGPSVAVLDGLNTFKFTFDSKEFFMEEEKKVKDAGMPEEMSDEAVTLEAVVKLLKELKMEVTALKAAEQSEVSADNEGDTVIDAEFEPKKAEDKDADVEDAECKDAKGDESKSDGDAKKPMDKAMDAKLVRKMVADEMSAVRADITARDQLAAQLSHEIGVFACDSMSHKDVAKYGVKKLKEIGIALDAKQGEEIAVLKGYFAACSRQSHQSTFASDASFDEQNAGSIVDDIFAGAK